MRVRTLTRSGTASLTVAMALAATTVLPGPQPATAATSASAPAEWQLDPSFSDDGVTTTHLNDDEDEADWADDVAVQPDGKIVVAGTHHNFDFDARDTADVVVVRYRTNGTLDPTFGDGGTVRVSLGKYDEVGGVALQELGGETRIVVSGHVFRPPGDKPRHQAFVVRLHPDGSLDTDSDADSAIHLDHDGLATVPFRHGGFGGPVVIDPDNRIVVAGSAQRRAPGVDVTAVLRLLPQTGARDSSLGGDGTVVLRPLGRPSAARDLAIQAVGSGYRLIVVGSIFAPSGTNWVVTRLRLDGTYDPAFGDGDGVVVLPMRARRVEQSFESASAVAVGPEGDVTVVGTYRVWDQGSSDGPADVPAMVRLQPAGQLDEGFSDNGKVRLAHSDGGLPDRDARDVVLGADGNAYWAGTRYWPTGGEKQWFLVGGRHADGSPDLRFGKTGSMAVSVGPSADTGYAITQDLDGRLVAVGIADPESSLSIHAAFAVARLRLG